MIKVKLINRSDNPVPEFATEGSAGVDLRAFIEDTIVLKPLERAIVPTGLFIELPLGTEAQIRPRSGLAAKSGITVLNSPGTIDSDYRGEIKVIMVNLSNDSFEISNGDRICQMVVHQYERFEWNNVVELNESGRGAGGFGHTGV
ncbi:dUTP diphosphatase [Marinilabilia salmonicolor]|uniref:dUTP diphosphatase n=1 Tax=Marinilabilia salmonicolor TaxID=989 RepID=UPI00029A4E0D|nr:dUTP diphosphatase [Marinilabilia salmonicolor]